MSFLDMLGNMFGGGSGQQQDLINQLQGVANGTGPNPALAMLKQQTDANNAAASGQIAGAAGMSPALRERQIMETQRSNQQNAAAQGATLQAQQSLGALGQMGSVISDQRKQDTGFGSALVGGLFGGASGAAGLAGSGGGGGAAGFGGSGGAAAVAGLADGGEVPRNHPLMMLVAPAPHLAHGGLAYPMDGSGFGPNPNAPIMAPSRMAPLAGGSNVMAGGGFGPNPNHPLLMLVAGGPVPGRAKVQGDSSVNDTVPAKLSPGEIVLPRSVTEAEDAPEKARAFVLAIRRKRAGGRR